MATRDEPPTRPDLPRPPPWALSLTRQMGALQQALEAAQLHMIDLTFSILTEEAARRALQDEVRLLARQMRERKP